MSIKSKVEKFEAAVERDVDDVEARVRQAEEAAIAWFHQQRVAQHNEAVGAIQANHERDLPALVEAAHELPPYNPHATPAPTPVEVAPAAPDNAGYPAVTVTDAPKDAVEPTVAKPTVVEPIVVEQA